jgi:hypothetical protein
MVPFWFLGGVFNLPTCGKLRDFLFLAGVNGGKLFLPNELPYLWETKEVRPENGVRKPLETGSIL